MADNQNQIPPEYLSIFHEMLNVGLVQMKEALHKDIVTSLNNTSAPSTPTPPQQSSESSGYASTSVNVGLVQMKEALHKDILTTLNNTSAPSIPTPPQQSSKSSGYASTSVERVKRNLKFQNGTYFTYLYLFCSCSHSIIP